MLSGSQTKRIWSESGLYSFNPQETGSPSIAVVFAPLLKCRLLMCTGIAVTLKLPGFLCKCNVGELWSVLYLKKSICAASAKKAVPGRDNAASLQERPSGYFSSACWGIQGVFQTGNKCKNVLYELCVCMGSLAEHWVSDWMITYCLIVIRIIKVINWL